MQHLLFRNDQETFLGRVDSGLAPAQQLADLRRHNPWFEVWEKANPSYEVIEIPEKSFRIVKFDETRNWDDEIAANGKKIWGYYLVNMFQYNYLCEPTPSVAAHFLYNRFEDTQWFDEDELTSMEGDNGGEDWSYFRLRDVENFVREVEMPDMDFDSIDEVWEYLVEYYRSNPVE